MSRVRASRSQPRLGRALCVASLLGSALIAPFARATPTEPDRAGVNGDFPKRLAITVVFSGVTLPTFEQRISSWFSDGTKVRVSVNPELDAQQLLASDPGEVRSWVVPLSAEQALVTFSTVTTQAPARYLVREVRLQNGLDDLGLERLASVIHSAFLAMREGEEGMERAQVERVLVRAGLLDTAPSSPTMPDLPLPLPLPPHPVANCATAPEPAHAEQHPAWLLFGIGYGGRLRGPEGLGQGPHAELGLQIPSRRGPVDLLVSAHYLLRSTFEAGNGFAASVQTTALRALAGLEPKLGASLSGQLLVGVGADFARIQSSTNTKAESSELVSSPRAVGSQWRAASELEFGILRYSDLVDLGLSMKFVVLFGDDHYSATTDAGEQRLLTPWQIQPSLSLQGRFRSAL